MNRKLPASARNSTVQLLTVYIDPECHNARSYRRTDGQRQTTLRC